MRSARRVAAIPSADLAAMHRPWVVTTVVRFALAVLVIALLAGAFAAARSLDPREAAFLPEGRTGIVVLDVSKSVTDPVYRRIARTLERLASSRQSVGLIVFSDLPYEMLPPGSPASELRPIVRYFEPRPGFDPDRLGSLYPRNPWNEVFSGGTQISSGLLAAQYVITRDRIEDASVLLISDLDTAPSDEARLTTTLAGLQTSGLDLRVVPLFPNDGDRLYFEALLGRDAMITPARLEAQIARDAGASLVGQNPRLLALLGGLLVFALAANEWWCRRVDLPRGAVA